VRRSSLPPCIARADGFTMVEVLVAMAVLAVGVLGLVGAFDSARRLNLLSERRTAMAHRAQLEIERLQTYPFSQLAMISKPSHSGEKSNPDYYVKGVNFAWNAENSSEEEALVTAEKEVDCTVKAETGCGLIAASPAGRECSAKLGACEKWSDGLVNGKVYDFVTYHTDSSCTKCQVKEKAYKRLTVVVTATVPAGNHEIPPLRVSTLLAEPSR
jgi:prepilin-type N-terminal cleavage/methylation domain-containing protein